MFFHQQQQQVVEENMPNLTSASGETLSVSSSNRTEASDSSFNLQQQNFALPNQQQQQAQIPKRKRNQPGNPDPDAEVISLSPKSLLATNRFVCEICNKGFQRDQNLQLHRRGHNLPWKLKQRANKDVVRKKVYVCPESSCVHHDPLRALGDLTGIKKHYCRKHGEKKWKCEKCSKKYAVRSDWKAHSKTCGTREYRCDCGTLFSRRDSFITHRAFCDALAEESAKAITTTAKPNHLMIPPTQNLNLQIPKFEENNTTLNALPPKEEQTQSDTLVHNHYTPRSLHDQIIGPPWLSPNQPHSQPLDHPSPRFSHHNEGGVGGLAHTGLFSHPSSFHLASPHMSATALLQKAAQLGSSTNRGHVAADDGSSTGMITTTAAETSNINASLFQGDYMMNSATGFDQVGSFDETLGGFLRPETESRNGTNKIEDQGGEGMTRDFLGLKPLSHSDILSFAGFGNCISTDEHQQQHSQSQEPWQG